MLVGAAVGGWGLVKKWGHYRMASAITHFIVGGALALPVIGSRRLVVGLSNWAIPITAGLLAAAPDLDTYAARLLGIPYGSFFGHRGFFHTPFFLAILACVAAIVIGRGAPRTCLWLSLVYAMSAITHPLLDMLTDGGAGIMAIFPFSEQRLFFPWRPIRVSPLSVARFFQQAGDILRSELPFCAGSIAIGSLLLLIGRYERLRR